MITPTTEMGRPAAITPRSIVGDTSFALPTTPTSATSSARLPRGARRRGALVLDDRAVRRHG